MGRGFFILSPEVLIEKLNMPSNSQIDGVEWDFMTNSIKIFVSHEGLPETLKGAVRQYTPYLEWKWD